MRKVLKHIYATGDWGLFFEIWKSECSDFMNMLHLGQENLLNGLLLNLLFLYILFLPIVVVPTLFLWRVIVRVAEFMKGFAHNEP